MKMGEKIAIQKRRILELESELLTTKQYITKWTKVALEVMIDDCERDPKLAEKMRDVIMQAMEEIIADKNIN